MVWRRSLTFVVLAACVTVSQPCAGQITDAEEVAAGKRGLQQLIDSGEVTLVQDPAVKERLQRVGKRVAEAAGRPGLGWAGGWQWLPVRFASGPNARGGPGGFVLMDTRLLDELASDDELAYVLAHEAGHIVGRHSFRMLLDKGRVASWLSDKLAQLLESHVDPLLGELVRGELKFSREMELEADERALAIMQRAGFDTQAALRWMAAWVYTADEPAILTLWGRYMETHPPMADRAAHLLEYKQKVLDKGPFLAFVRDDTLWISKWDGSEQRRTSLSGCSGGEPEWSPRGDAVALECEGNIFVIRATDLNVTQLTTSGKASAPAWAAGGDKIACVSTDDIYVVSADGRQKRRLTTTRDCYSPAWSPGGDRVVYARWWRRENHPTEDRGVWMVLAGGDGARELAKGSEERDFDETVPIFSPDGTMVLYNLFSGQWGVRTYVVELSGASSARAVASYEGASWWSPGGKYLFCSCDNPDSWPMTGLSQFHLDEGRLEKGIAFEGRSVGGVVEDGEWARIAVFAADVGPGENIDAVQSELWVISLRELNSKKLRVPPTDWYRLVAWAPDDSGVLLAGGRLDAVLSYETIWLAPFDGCGCLRLIEKVWLPALSEPWPYVL